MVDRVDNMKRNAIGNGSSQCILCGDEFRLLGASPNYCDDCKKVSTIILFHDFVCTLGLLPNISCVNEREKNINFT